MVAVNLVWIALGQERDEDRSDRALLLNRDEAGGFHPRAVSPSTRPLQGLFGGLTARLVVEAAERLDGAKNARKERRQAVEIVGRDGAQYGVRGLDLGGRLQVQHGVMVLGARTQDGPAAEILVLVSR